MNTEQEVHRPTRKEDAYSVSAATGGGITVFFLWLANPGIRHAEGFAARENGVRRRCYGWLIWRLCVYCALGWWGWKIWHAPGFRPNTGHLFFCMATVSVLFVLLCEYSIFACSGR